MIEISCTPALDCREPFGSGSAAPDAPISDEGEGEEAGSIASPPPILVFDDADQLSEVQIKVLFDAAQTAPLSAPAREARVLLAHSSFTTRFEGPLLDVLKGRLAAHLCLQQLDRDEVEAFIRYQLAPDSRSNFLTAQRAALIAITSGGDPTVVNRLARRMLERRTGRAGPADVDEIVSQVFLALCRGERTHAETGKPSDFNTSAGACAIMPKPKKPMRLCSGRTIVTLRHSRLACAA